MTNKTMIAKAVKAALFGGLAASFATTAPVAFAAEEGDEEANVVTTTGSRIRGVDLAEANPVQVVTKEDIERTGSQSIGDILQDIPAAGSALNTTFNNGGNGSTTVDLRNLGSNRLLVLVNGRRWTPGLGGSVDLNNIPVSIIERVEILKDGASAVYGSDAIAGVVNVITTTDYEGMNASAYLGETSEGDGETQNFSVGMGAASDTSSAYLNVSYTQIEPVFAGDREIAAVPVFGAPVGYGGSSGTPDGRFLHYDPAGNFFNNAGDGAGGFVPWDNVASRFNFAPFNYLVTPQERTNLYAQASHQINDTLRFRSEVFYGNRKSEQLLAPTPLFVGLFGSGLGTQTVIGANNPFNPLGYALDSTCSDPTAGCLLLTGRRMIEAGFRSFSQDVDQWQFSAGFDGEFEALDRVFNWDFNYTYARISQNTLTDGLLNMQRVNLALSDACLTDSTCVPLNLFGGSDPASFTGTITPAMINYITFTAQDTLETDSQDITFNIAGDMFELPAGVAKFAFGLERRFEEGFDQPDALIAAGITSGNSRQPTQGAYDLEEAYVEFDLPLLSDVALAKSLSLQVASRYSKYSNFGSTTNNKLGFRWQPMDDLVVRGTFSEGFRAPSIFELFQGQGDSFPTLTDPCSDFTNSTDPNVIANCQADGVPTTYIQPNQQIRITVGGNPDLGPEETESQTFGFVYSPEQVDGLTVSVDWYDIEIDNAVTTVGAQNILNSCYAAAPGDRALCNFITRSSAGNVSDLFNGNVNAANLSTEGADLAVNYSFDTDELGTFGIIWDTSYVDKYGSEFTDDTTGNTVFINNVGVGFGGGLIPRFRSNIYLDWNYGDWGVSWTTRYIHAVTESCDLGTSASDNAVEDALCTFINDPADATDNQQRLGGTTYHDLRVTYNVADWDSQLAFGIRNIGDKDPPISYAAFANSFDPTQYDAPGSFYYLRLSTNF
ncbi:TonB-dependent siderophore receptor [Kangiella sp. HZ709]|uniref:TonB-dependent receptor plug domain-containing protein n=1 Tax=Kangiella sp. HZ709 TaxID=2666328 RepID=UPI0012AFD8B8|nr:TonB-dependent receptor [Kangiella sp. HZ709]MRX28243.1 TonB-dependent receptor [Kangiella sp. HZ709]